MIKHHRAHEIDRERWDECIRKSFNGIIYAYSWYLDIVCPSWEALIEGDYKIVMPLSTGKKMGLRYLYPPYFVQQLGVFSVDKLTAEAVIDFLKAIPKEFKYAEINLNTFNNVSGTEFNFISNLTHELDLIGSYEASRMAYTDNTKRNVKKSEQNNLDFVENPSREAIITLFRKGRGADVKNLKEQEYDVLRRLLQALDARGRLHTRGVLDANGELIAGAFFVDSNSKVIFLFSGLSELGKTMGAMFFLIDRFIAANSNKNLVLDFEGSNDPKLSRFYKGFGAKECVYLQARINKLPWFISWYKR